MVFFFVSERIIRRNQGCALFLSWHKKIPICSLSRTCIAGWIKPALAVECSGMPKSERLKSEQCQNLNDCWFGYIKFGFWMFGLFSAVWAMYRTKQKSFGLDHGLDFRCKFSSKNWTKSFGFWTNSKAKRFYNRPKVDCLKSELVWILAFHCTYSNALKRESSVWQTEHNFVWFGSFGRLDRSVWVFLLA